MTKVKGFARFIYSLIGISGLIFLLGLLLSIGDSASIIQSDTPFVVGFSWAVVIAIIIGNLNWGIIAITGDKDKDLFGLMGL